MKKTYDLTCIRCSKKLGEVNIEESIYQGNDHYGEVCGSGTCYNEYRLEKEKEWSDNDIKRKEEQEVLNIFKTLSKQDMETLKEMTTNSIKPK